VVISTTDGETERAISGRDIADWKANNGAMMLGKSNAQSDDLIDMMWSPPFFVDLFPRGCRLGASKL
jgi:hypothetical protein